MHFLALDTRGIICVFTDLQTPVTFSSGNKASTYILPSFDANACHLEVDTTLYQLWQQSYELGKQREQLHMHLLGVLVDFH